MHSFLRPFLNRGGAGPSLDRPTTARRLLPILERHYDLLNAYDHAVERLHNRELAEQIRRFLPDLRTEMAKLRETIWSMGSNAPNGVGLLPPDLGADDSDLIHGLDELERAYRDALRAEIGLNHQIRTLAIINNNLSGSERRIDIVHPVATRTRRTRIR
jgi:hypothetical protein